MKGNALQSQIKLTRKAVKDEEMPFVAKDLVSFILKPMADSVLKTTLSLIETVSTGQL